jgi:hypothetical protein
VITLPPVPDSVSNEARVALAVIRRQNGAWGGGDVYSDMHRAIVNTADARELVAAGLATEHADGLFLPVVTA